MSKTQKRRFTNCCYLTDARPGDIGVLKVCHMLQVGLRTATGFKVLFILSKDRGVDIVVKPRVAPLIAIGSSLLVMKKTMMARAKEWLPAYDYKEFARLMRTNDLEGLLGRKV